MRCEDCPLKGQACISPYGSKAPKLIVVGEAPGAEEVVRGQPFVGKSGKLIRRLLREFKIDDESDVYWTNVIMCHPPDNRNPKAAEVKACSSRLREEIQTVVGQSRDNGIEPTILTLGNFSSKTILGVKEGITTLRLQEHTEPTTGVKVVCTFHPAAAMYTPDKLPSIVEDLERMTSSIKIAWEPTKYKVYDEPQEAQRAINELARFPQLAIDVEVDGKPQNFEWLCIGISHMPGKACVFTPRTLPQLETLFHQKPKLIGQNIKFDVQYLANLFADPEPWDYLNIAHDTMLLSFASDERKGAHGLEQLASRFVQAPNYKQEAKKWLPNKSSHVKDLPPEILYKYNATDVDVTYRILEPLLEKVTQDDVLKPYSEIMIPVSSVLAKMEYYGVPVDQEYLDNVEEELVFALGKIEERFNDWNVNPRSPVQVKQALARLGFHVGDTTALTLSEVDHEFAHTLLEHRAKHKLLSTYAQGIKSRVFNGRVYPSYLIHGTETGRLSSRDPNIQNQPRDKSIRDIYCAPDGKLLMQSDYSAIELRVAAVLSKDKWLTDKFMNNEHVHKEAAKLLFGEHYTEEQYVLTKSFNFGILYGESPGHLAARLNVSKTTASKHIQTFFRRSPGLVAYHSMVRDKIREDGELVSYYGRKRRFWLVTDDNAYDVYKEGYNFPIQSMASDIMLQALIDLDKHMPHFMQPILTVHDSVMFEVDKDYKEEAEQFIKEHMEVVIEGIPMEVEIKSGERWGSLS